MSVPYYIGAKAIAERLGYKTPKMALKLMERDGLPLYKRVTKNPKNPRSVIRTWCISESAITAWELVMGARFVNELRARKALKLERTHGALTA